MRILEGHDNRVESVCQLSNGLLASGSFDKKVRVWAVSSGVSAVLNGHKNGVNSVCALGDGQIASGSYDKTVRIWQVSINEDGGVTGKCLRILKGHSSWVLSVCALSDGRLASASEDKTVRVWDASSGACLRVLEGHTGGVVSVCALSDGGLASASWDNTVRVWSPAEVEGHDIRFRNALSNIKNVEGRSRAKTARKVLNTGTRGNSRLMNRVLSYLPGSRLTVAPNRFNSKVYNEEQRLLNKYPKLKGFIPSKRNDKVLFIEGARNFMEANPNMNENNLYMKLRNISNKSRKTSRELRNWQNSLTRRRK